jgi:predicted nucleic acid-binding protein
MRVSSLALDACCLLNLVAAGKILHENFTKTGFSFFVPRVVAKESIYILQPDDDHSGQLVRREVDMNQYVDRKLVSYCDIEGSCEAEWYVRFAVQIDDGEAACLAIAKSRSWILATDDRVARRLATEQSVKVLGTPEIVRTWAESNAVSESEISSVIGNIQRYAKYVPRSNVPDAGWWYQKQSAG